MKITHQNRLLFKGFDMPLRSLRSFAVNSLLFGALSTQAADLSIRPKNFIVTPSTGPVAEVIVQNNAAPPHSGTITPTYPEGWQVAPLSQTVELAGDGLQVQAALAENMGASELTIENEEAALSAALGAGGAALAAQLPDIGNSDLIILMGDAHSPKNQYLIDGLQRVAGTDVPVTGGSISKNDGLNFITYRGEMYSDSTFALTIKDGLSVEQAGRQAKSNDQVISTAAEGASAALNALTSGTPVALLAFDCAGRMDKLDNLSDEVNIIKTKVDPSVPIFGTYCAGEFGPADTTVEQSGNVSKGRGWHVMFSVLGK